MRLTRSTRIVAAGSGIAGALLLTVALAGTATTAGAFAATSKSTVISYLQLDHRD